MILLWYVGIATRSSNHVKIFWFRQPPFNNSFAWQLAGAQPPAGQQAPVFQDTSEKQRDSSSATHTAHGD